MTKDRKDKRRLVNASLSQEKYDELAAYAKEHTQGNLSYAVRLAIELLLSESAKFKQANIN